MTKPAPIDDTKLCSIVANLVKDAEEYRNDRSAEREKAMAFFDGDAEKLAQWIPADEGRSKVVSRDVRAQVRKIMPSIDRSLLRSEKIVDYEPVGEGDEDGAEQASDYINFITLKECDGRAAVRDAVLDALKLRNGILKWWFNEKTEIRVSRHSGLDEMAFAQLVSEDDVEVLEHSERLETIDQINPMTGEPEKVETIVHDLRIKRKLVKRIPRLAAIPPESFIVHSDAKRLEDSPIVGEVIRLRRSDLVAMGYDRSLIDSLPVAGTGTTEQEAEEDARRREQGIDSDKNAEAHAMQEVDFWDLLVRVDQDNDGIAELRRIVFAGAIKPEYMLENEEWDEVNYADIVVERRPHQWEGNSIADETMDIQTIKTVLLRQTLDNLYWQNNQQPVVQEGAVVDMDAVMNPSFGKPVRVNQGVDVRTALAYNPVPMVADKSFGMLEYLDGAMADRTGINDASGGLPPDALQNVTAKASALMEQGGIGQTEEMLAAIAESLKPAFRGLLRLVTKHQDKPRTVRLRKKWVTFDPRDWNADMDAEVNVGLGAGSRERDMHAMLQVLGLQERILQGFGPVVGKMFVTVDNLYNTISRLVQASGLTTVDLYFTKPEQEAVDQALQAQAQQPSPEQIKAETTLAVEDKRTEREMLKTQVQTQAKREEAQLKAQVDANREQQQLAADIETRRADIEIQGALEGQKIRAETLNNEADRALERQKMTLDYQMHREDLQSRERTAEANAKVAVQKAQAQSFGKSLSEREKGK